MKSLVMALIEPLAAGYKDLYKTQRRNEKLKESKKDEFFGLRDFYRFELQIIANLFINVGSCSTRASHGLQPGPDETPLKRSLLFVII